MAHPDHVPPEVVDSRRLSALIGTGLLDSPPEKGFDGLTQLVARLLGVPVSLVSLVDVDRQFFKSACGLPEPWASERQTPLSHSFCKHVVATKEPLVVNNATEHPLVCDNLAIRDLGVVAYLGIPLRTPDSSVVGSLCAIDGSVRNWTEDDIAMLSVVADAVMNEIAVRIQMQKIRTYADQLLMSNERLVHYSSELRAANATKDRFFSIIAHDLRGPLHALLGYSGVLVEESSATPTSHMHEFAVRLRTASERMARLLENLLQWSRVQTGHLKCQSKDILVGTVLNETLESVEQQAEQKGVALTSDLGSAVSAFADPQMVSCIAHNLLTNAIKFTTAGGKVRLTVEDVGDAVEIVVQDSGVGMDSKTVAGLFSLAQPTSSAGTDGETGTGLGLVLCRELVELNFGRIWAVSQVGEGTRMHFTIPKGSANLSRMVA